jgi:hypothetical protein
VGEGGGVADDREAGRKACRPRRACMPCCPPAFTHSPCCFGHLHSLKCDPIPHPTHSPILTHFLPPPPPPQTADGVRVVADPPMLQVPLPLELCSACPQAAAAGCRTSRRHTQCRGLWGRSLKKGCGRCLLRLMKWQLPGWLAALSTAGAAAVELPALLGGLLRRRLHLHPPHRRRQDAAASAFQPRCRRRRRGAAHCLAGAGALWQITCARRR